MDIAETLLSFGTMTVAVVAAYLLFRKNPRQNVISRGPLFVICFLVFFYFGFVHLPLAMPGAFERVLGHSVWMNYMPPVRINVTQEGGTWWVVRWLDPIRQGYFYVLLVGIAWAVVNVVRRRAWKANLACLGSAVPRPNNTATGGGHRVGTQRKPREYEKTNRTRTTKMRKTLKSA